MVFRREHAFVPVSFLLCLSLGACESTPAGDGDDAGTTGTTDGSEDTATTDTDTTGDTTGDTDTGVADVPTYWRDTKSILDARCVNCHREGEVAPFSLETWAEVETLAPILAPAITDESMPPWPPAAGCNSYAHDRSLSAEERDTMLAWLDAGYPEGDPADVPPDPEPPAPFEPTFTVSLPEPYTPKDTLDDYRCFAIPWPAEYTEDTFVVAQDYFPDRRELVHHVIAFYAGPGEAAFYQNLDDADPAPGYECFGGPGKTDWSAAWLGAWAPGQQPWRAPEGTGLRVEPGSLLIVQVHYNSLAGSPGPDQTSLGFEVVPAVDRPAAFVPVVEFGWVTGGKPMTIPAGESNVMHSTTLPRSSPIFLYLTAALGVSANATLDIWNASLHMHMLGTQAQILVDHSDTQDECLLYIDDWDFNWQGAYELEKPVSFGTGDSLSLTCAFDNSAENQPIVDGQPKEPETVEWGDGTFDEMCLGIIYVAAQG
ncbi:MAG: monooxygenase [Myxococcales bacterium]|nr:monooxygenase [Myxococcales bacterium]